MLCTNCLSISRSPAPTPDLTAAADAAPGPAQMNICLLKYELLSEIVNLC